MWFIDLSTWIFRSLNAFPEPILHFMLILSILINLSFTLGVTYKGLTQSESLSGIQAFQKYAASRLKQSDCEAIIRELTLCMKTEKPYLTPSLSVDDLARKLKIPARHLSQAIHTCLNQNFYDFINSYRIEESKKYIRDESYSNQTLLAIAYDAGFNSKSVFNAAFKKNTGLTPKEYKQRSDRNMGYSQEC
jgi:AraC-like DNA-binding protein